MNLVDSHCHLDDRQFDEDREAVIERALEVGVTRMLSIGTGDGPPDLEAAVRLADRYSFIYASGGVHPHDASKADGETFRRLEQVLKHPKVLAVGEIGLDYYYDHSPRGRQQEVFVEQLRIASDARLPVIIHTRDAWDDTMRLLRQHWQPTGLGGIMHCFSGGPDEARQALELGLHISFAGIVTFPKADTVREAARIVPLDRLLVETDCPYLAPAPKRGRRNEPSFAVHTARRLAELRELTLDHLADATAKNFNRLCLPPPDPDE